MDKNVVGESHHSKISKVVRYLKLNKADYLFVSAPENVAWLLNIRGYDNPNSPIANAKLILNKKMELFLIANENNFKVDINGFNENMNIQKNRSKSVKNDEVSEKWNIGLYINNNVYRNILPQFQDLLYLF